VGRGGLLFINLKLIGIISIRFVCDDF